MTNEEKVKNIIGSIEVSSGEKKKKHDSKAFLRIAADVKEILEDEHEEEPLDTRSSSL